MAMSSELFTLFNRSNRTLSELVVTKYPVMAQTAKTMSADLSDTSSNFPVK
jgi:hypothetical protein